MGKWLVRVLVATVQPPRDNLFANTTAGGATRFHHASLAGPIHAVETAPSLVAHWPNDRYWQH